MKATIFVFFVISLFLVGCVQQNEQPTSQSMPQENEQPASQSMPQEPVVQTPKEEPVTVPSTEVVVSDSELDDLTSDLEGLDDLLSDLDESSFEDLEIDEETFE